MSERLRVAVVGATGYAGGELIRLLAGHPQAEIASLHARERDHAALAEDLPHLAPLGALVTDDEPGEVDVAFLALPPGASAELAVRLAARGVTVIDIGSDLRLRDPSAYPAWYGFAHPCPGALGDVVYGLTELVHDRLPGARLIANPGCYPTAALLALAPFAAAGQLTGDVIVDAKSGISGAGRGVGRDYLFTELTEATRAYGLDGHRHRPEIEQGLTDAGGGPDGEPIGVTFVPHLVPQARGLLATCYVSLVDDLTDADLAGLLATAYGNAAFVHVVHAPPSTKHASGTNHAFLHARRTGERRSVVLAAIDNLGKGAAGQAIQNMNVALGLDETAGLTGLAVFP